MDFEKIINKLRGEIKDEYRDIISSDKHTNKLKKFAEEIKKDIANKKNMIFGLLSEREKKEKEIIGIQEEISKKIYASAENIKQAKHTSKKFREFLQKKTQINEMIDTLNKNRNELRNELVELIKKVKLFRISSKDEDSSKEIIGLENKFNEIDKKKNIFEKELKKFMSLFS